MFLILMLHANYYSLGKPTQYEMQTFPFQTFARCFFEAISLISVNLFVLISGWFGIKFSLKRLAGFVFQSIFVITVVYAVGLLLGRADLGVGQIADCLFLGEYGWFIKAYLGLYIFSPILNSFVKTVNQRQFLLVLICFYSFQTVYSCLSQGARFIESGYSTFSFCGLYLLAQYIRNYGQSLLVKSGRIFVSSISILVVSSSMTATNVGGGKILQAVLTYTNPFNILASLGLILFVVRLKPRYNRLLNFIAASTFAVYLCHMCNHWSAQLYLQTSQFIFNSFSGTEYLLVISFFMIGVFVISIIIDIPRRMIWHFILHRFINR